MSNSKFDSPSLARPAKPQVILRRPRMILRETRNPGAMIQIYSTRSPEYLSAHQTFLAHSNQKDVARMALDEVVNATDQRNLFVDAGAGTGLLTQAFSGLFARTLAIEPSPACGELLQAHCPEIEWSARSILEAEPAQEVDFGLCSDTLYHLAPGTWLAHLAKMAHWLSPDGILAVLLQSGESDLRRMVQYFYGPETSLNRAREEFNEAHGDEFETETIDLESHVEVADIETAYTICELMLNSATPRAQVSQNAVLEYIDRNFRDGDGYRFSCSEQMLLICRRGEGAAISEEDFGFAPADDSEE